MPIDVDDPTECAAPRRSPAPVLTPGERACRIFEAHQAVGLSLLLAGVFLLSAWVSHVRPFWFDELFTMMLATQPTLHAMWEGMPADGNPPLMDLLVRGSIHVLGANNFAARVPSMLAFVAACAALYLFVRRRTGAVGGLLAVSVVLFQPAWAYSFESRPYALMLAFFMITLLCWQRATMPGPRRLYLAGIAFGIVGIMLSHYVGLVVVGFPLLLGEAVRFARRRKPDWPMYATYLTALPMLAITFPMMHRTRAQLLTLAIHHQPKITVHVILDWLWDVKVNMPTILSAPMLIALAVLIVVTWRGWFDRNACEICIPAHEIAAAIGASLLIPVTLFLLMFSSNYYNCRYGIVCVLGFGILAAFGMARNLPRQRDVTAALILLLLAGFVLNAKAWHNSEAYIPTLPVVPAAYAGQPVVMTNVFTFYPAWWYGSPQQRRDLHFLFDMQTAVLDNYAIPETALMLERGHQTMHLDQFADFVAMHDRFVAYVPPQGVGSELAPRLEESGLQLRPIGTPGGNFYEVTRGGVQP